MGSNPMLPAIDKPERRLTAGKTAPGEATRGLRGCGDKWWRNSPEVVILVDTFGDVGSIPAGRFVYSLLSKPTQYGVAKR